MHALEERLYLTSPVFVQNVLMSSRGRKLLRERFQCGVFDGYSQADRVVYSAECDHHRGHHLLEGHGICEIVDGDGNPAEPSAPGQLVGTGLHNMAMPLPRHDVGDVVARLTKVRTCGRSAGAGVRDG